MEPEKEYLSILDLLGRVVEANKGIKLTNETLSEAESLAIKLFHHSASALYLSRGTIISDFPSARVNFFDHSSINVLTRAALESYLIFHYLHGANVSEEDRELRFYSRQLAGLKESQDFPYTILNAREILKRNQERISRCEEILGKNIVFRGLKRKRQKRILAGDWRLLSWRDIATDAGLSELNAKNVYRYLCGYAHSGSLSTLQVGVARTAETQSALFSGSMGVIKIAISNLILEYCRLFPKSGLELSKDENTAAKITAENWVWIGRKE
ncbi:MAG: DUF5677 domain-containing protein [Candidatus Zixiibacteriota bacterium]